MISIIFQKKRETLLTLTSNESQRPQQEYTVRSSQQGSSLPFTVVVLEARNVYCRGKQFIIVCGFKASAVHTLNIIATINTHSNLLVGKDAVNGHLNWNRKENNIKYNNNNNNTRKNGTMYLTPTTTKTATSTGNNDTRLAIHLSGLLLLICGKRLNYSCTYIKLFDMD